MTAAQPALLPPTEPARMVRCRGCRRPLYDAESRALGIGPECRAQEYARRRGEVEQEPIPGV